MCISCSSGLEFIPASDSLNQSVTCWKASNNNFFRSLLCLHIFTQLSHYLQLSPTRCLPVCRLYQVGNWIIIEANKFCNLLSSSGCSSVSVFQTNLNVMTKSTLKVVCDPYSGLKYVTLSKEKTKSGGRDLYNRHGNSAFSNIPNLMPELVDTPLCPVKSFEKYLSKLHPLCDRLWQRPHRKAMKRTITNVSRRRSTASKPAIATIKHKLWPKHGSSNNRASSGTIPRSVANKHLEQNTTAIPGGSEWTFENIRSEMDVNTSQSFLNPSTSSPSINSYNLNTQNSGIDTKPLTVNQADLKKQQLEFLEAQMLQADVEAKKRQAEVQKRQAELAEAKKLAEKLAEEERLRKESENKIYKYMVLNHEKKILETLRALWKGNQFCDATLQNECISIPVHKILLIACCPKILETYDYIMKDTNVQVCFPRKVTAEALKAFVDYLYNGSLNLSKSILDSMEYLSGMLGLDDIRQLCNQFRSDMLNDSICLPDKTIVNVTNSHDQSSHQMSYNDPILPPPPIVRPSTHSTATPTAVSIQLSSNFQDVSVSSAQSNDFSLFPEPHSNSVLTECDNNLSFQFPVPVT
ncbi:unnamed protein product [Acanthosepion pharaonis]|uniref:BTB domain-containing protein n=1 Tax=Acanthosepion pharaonis TaxID=158019 RepID=A0A812EJ74_ACAPH|nr:unnamed protein product [Sepia pharaonis]